MAKRMFTILILIVYILSISAVPVQAAEENYQRAEIIVESFGKQYTESVLISEDNVLLVPVDWFTRYGLMFCLEEDQQYVFCYPGEEANQAFAKRIYVAKDGRNFNCGVCLSESAYQTYIAKAFSQSARLDDMLYLPMAEMLPLFNAKTEITDDGILHINANVTSLFSALYGLNLRELAFNAERDMIGHKFISASSLVVDTILNLRIDRLDGLYDTGEYNDYRELFKSYLTDDEAFLSAYDEVQTPPERYWETKRNELKEIDGILSDVKIGPDFFGYILDSDLYPEFHAFKDCYSGAGDAVEGVYKLADYSNTYMNQVEDHVRMLEAVYQEPIFGEANPACRAALQIAATYGQDGTKQKKELLHSAFVDFISEEYDDILIEAVELTPYKIAFSAVKIIQSDAVEEISKGAKLSYMDTVVNDACRVFEKRVDNLQFDAESLDILRLSSMLALVASRNAYTTFWEDHEKVAQIDRVLEGIYLSADSLADESAEHYSELNAKLNKTASMLDVVITEKVAPPEDNSRIAEEALEAYGEMLWYGVCLSTDNGKYIPATHYVLFDMNADNIPEIIIYALYYHIPVFEIYTYSEGAAERIADSLNTCDVSAWTNASHDLSISDEKAVYAIISAANSSYDSQYLLHYDGKSVTVSDTDYWQPISEQLIENGEIVGGILIGSPEDWLTKHAEETHEIICDSLEDGEYYAKLLSWDQYSMTVELYEFEGWNEEYVYREFTTTGRIITLDISKSSVWLESAWSEDGEDIQCQSIDAALNTKIWGGGTTVGEQCSMLIIFGVDCTTVAGIMILYTP